MGAKFKITAKMHESTGKRTVSKANKRVFPKTESSPACQVLHLQRTMGNQAVQRLLKSGTIQAKLKIGKPNDKYEQEADLVADKVMSMPEKKESLVIGHQSLVQKKTGCPECSEKEVQTKQAVNKTPTVTSNIESGIQSLKGGGQPLPESTRSYFEPRFGSDFSQVRVHTDSKSAETAKSINARAFTKGKDVVFGSGQYSPETSTGKQLLAHELTHVVQQNGATSKHQPEKGYEGKSKSLGRLKIARYSENETINRQPTVGKTCKSSTNVKICVKPNVKERATGKVIISVSPKSNIEIISAKAKIVKVVQGGSKAVSAIVQPGNLSLPADLRSRLRSLNTARKQNVRHANYQWSCKFKWDGKLAIKAPKPLYVDGTYRFEINIKYKGSSIFIKYLSPNIDVERRAYILKEEKRITTGPRKGTPTRFPHYNWNNCFLLAKIIATEMRGGKQKEQEAVAWAVRNQMIYLGTSLVEKARDVFKDKSGESYTRKSLKIAKRILKESISKDFTNKAFQFVSPKRLKDQHTTITAAIRSKYHLAKIPNKNLWVYFPNWVKDRTQVSISGIRPTYLMLYTF